MRHFPVPVLLVSVALCSGQPSSTVLRGWRLAGVPASSPDNAPAPDPGFVATPPVLGYLREGRRLSLRPVLGFPGAARMGDSFDVPASVSRLDISPGHAYALVRLRPDDTLGLLLLSTRDTIPNIITLPFGLGAADIVTFSPIGNSAAIFSATDGTIHIVTGLPLSATEVLSTSVSASARLFAVSDDGQRLLFADADDTLYLLKIGAPPEVVWSGSTYSAIQFLPNRHDAVIGESTLGNVILLRETAGPPAMRIITPRIDGMAEPRVVGVTTNGEAGLLADGLHNRVWSVNLKTGAITEYATPAPPRGFSRARNLDTFVVFSEGDVVSLLSWDGNELTSSAIPGSGRQHIVLRGPGR